MSGSISRKVACIFAASAMGVGSTTAVAATQPAGAAQPNSWAALTMMSGGAAALQTCAAAAAAATAGQPTNGCVLPQADAPAAAEVPQEGPAPLVAAPIATTAFGTSPLLLGLAALAAEVGLYFVLRHNDNTFSNSPF